MNEVHIRGQVKTAPWSYSNNLYVRLSLRRDNQRPVRGAGDGGNFDYVTVMIPGGALHVSLKRILDFRTELKHFEAGMDLGLSPDPEESFRIFQGRQFEQYLAMSTEYKFRVIDADQPIEAQQSIVRDIVGAHIDLTQYAREPVQQA